MQTTQTLTTEQQSRLHAAAFADSRHWLAEAKAGTLPDVSTMHLDWQIDEDLREAGVTPAMMQTLSFEKASKEAAPCDYCTGILPAHGAVSWGCTCDVTEEQFAENYRFWCD